VSLSYPILHEIVINWVDLELIFQYIFDQLAIKGSECSVLITQPPFNPIQQLEQLGTLFFEKFNVCSFCINSAKIGLFDTGRTSGVVMDIGESGCTIYFVNSGIPYQEGTKRVECGGRIMTDYLMGLLNEKMPGKFSSTADYEEVRRIKEAMCEVSEISVEPDSDYPTWKYTLQNGEEINLGTERFLCPEVLFRPSLYGLAIPGIHQALFDAIENVAIDFRTFLDIVLIGECARIPNLDKRLKSEIAILDEAKQRQRRIRYILPENGSNSLYLSGRLMVSLPTWRVMDTIIPRNNWKDKLKQIAGEFY